MKTCGRSKNGIKCGTLFEGAGSYCKSCRNDYQRDYYARRKQPFYKPVTEGLGSSCQACSTGLRSNTIEIIDEPGLETNVVLCQTCKAVVKYLSETVDEAAQEFLVDLAMELANLRYNQSEGGGSHVYKPQVLGPPTNNKAIEVCGYCEDPARPGYAFCEKHKDLEADYQESNAAKMARGEL